MPTNPSPTLVQLGPPGPYETPVVEAFQKLSVDQGTRLTRVHLRLEGGAELLVPLPPSVVEKLHVELGEYYEYPDIPELR